VDESWTRTVQIADRTFEVVFSRRPFREGFEVCVEVDGEVLTFGELGLGEVAALERVKSEVQAVISRT